ncbi:MAG: phosphorylase [Caldisphaera sp.]|uniref:purine-nucleoside phosphorylase n=1 Tax=Caldisphaera sp. TaxID=2060322 RepID=UPI000CC0C797|nr:MAG: phosphorylase [Caldisphaera sp.]PMP91012.1 MAG: phosphorylase [Caldisphaera sp.]
MKKVYHLDAEEAPERMIIMGDPQRVQMVSKLLRDPILVSKSRDLFVYKGYYNNVEVGLAAHGMGGPSAAIVIEELIKLGTKYIIRLGTVGSIVNEIDIGDIIVPTGGSFSYGGAGLGLYFNNICPNTAPSYELLYELVNELNKKKIKYYIGSVFSSDSFYAESNYIDTIRKLGFIGVEMECATLFALSNLRNIKSACILVVSNNVIKNKVGDYYNSIINAASVSLNVITKQFH